MGTTVAPVADLYRVAGRALEWTLPDGSTRRAEPGEVTADIPPGSVGALLADALITKEA